MSSIHFMRSILFLTIALLLAQSPSTNAADRGEFYLKDGDRVVFYGDSITEQRLYTTFAETFVVTRFPDLKVNFVHSGWGGDRVTGGGGGNIDKRLKRDVLAYNPTVVTIMLGMNDASYRAFDEAVFNTYTNGYESMVRTLKQAIPNLRLTLIQPSPFDDVTRPPNFPGGYNEVLVRYGKYIQELAEREKATVADLNTAVTEATVKANQKNKELAVKFNPDRVHPAGPGQLLMAAELVKAWKAPALVTAVEINGEEGKVSKSEGTTVTGLQNSQGLSWVQADRSLPMPVDLKDSVYSLAMSSSDLMETLNQQRIKVTGLKTGNYNLKIDGDSVGVFSHEELAAGLNLAALPTPMVKQAQEVHRFTLLHNELHALRWRQVQVKTEDSLPHKAAALKALDDLESDVVAQQRQAAKPLSRKYEIVPQI